MATFVQMKADTKAPCTRSRSRHFLAGGYGISKNRVTLKRS